jgi:hypothetical protein
MLLNIITPHSAVDRRRRSHAHLLAQIQYIYLFHLYLNLWSKNTFDRLVSFVLTFFLPLYVQLVCVSLNFYQFYSSHFLQSLLGSELRQQRGARGRILTMDISGCEIGASEQADSS